MNSCKYCKADCALRGEENLKECKGHIPMTNADRIRSMSDEELANFVHEGCPYIEEECTMKGCVKCIIEWLKQPLKEMR